MIGVGTTHDVARSLLSFLRGPIMAFICTRIKFAFACTGVRWVGRFLNGKFRLGRKRTSPWSFFASLTKEKSKFKHRKTRKTYIFGSLDHRWFKCQVVYVVATIRRYRPCNEIVSFRRYLWSFFWPLDPSWRVVKRLMNSDWSNVIADDCKSGIKKIRRPARDSFSVAVLIVRHRTVARASGRLFTTILCFPGLLPPFASSTPLRVTHWRVDQNYFRYLTFPRLKLLFDKWLITVSIDKCRERSNTARQWCGP